MSNEIDNRVVEMGFVNKDFESGVATTVKSLDNLKKGLDLTASAKSLDGLTAAGKNFSLQNISDGVSHISSGFSALGVIGITALSKIADSAIELGKQIFVAATGIDHISKGFQNYETQMNATQTILSNTTAAHTTTDQIDTALTKLNEYANKTIYVFADMTHAIGSFTAGGISLKTAVDSVKGITNVAAISGAGIGQASEAMNKLAMVATTGVAKLQDWKVLIDNGMGGDIFQKSLEETARVHGIAVDKMIAKSGSFEKSLKDGWLTTQVLTETLSKFTGDLSDAQLKSMGYTDKQIVGIQALAKQAQDAATKIKTFSQLQAVIGEAIDVGWTRSFEIVFGNFDEAKNLFTEISNTIGPLIQESSDARNNLLEGWKAFGGREEVIDSLRNVFEGLMSILKPIKEAFTDIFPPITAYQLATITENIKELTSHLKISSETADKVKAIFLGIASVFDLVIYGAEELIKWLAKIIAPNIPSSGSVLDFLASIGTWLLEFRNGIKYRDAIPQLFAGIKEKIEPVTTGISNFIKTLQQFYEKVKTFLEPIIGTIVKFFQGFIGSFGGVKDTFSNIFKGADLSGVDTFISTLKVRFAPLESLMKFVGGILNGIWSVVVALSPLFLKIGEFIGKALSSLGKSISEGVSKLDFSTIFDTVNTGLIAALVLGVTKFITSGAETLSSLTKIFDGLKNSLKAWQASLNAKTLMEIAGAIALLTISVIALSMIDSGKLTVALLAMTAMFGDLGVTLNEINKMSINSGALKVAPELIALGLAVLLLSAAVSNLAKLDQDQLQRGLIGVVTLMTALTGFTFAMSKISGQIIEGSLNLIVLAVALEILADVVKRLGAIDISSLEKGLIGVGILLLELVAFMNLTTGTSMNIGNGLGLLILAAAIEVLALAVQKFGNMDTDKLKQGLLAIGAVLLELALFVNLTGNSKNVIATAAGLTILGAAMLIFADAIKKMGDMSWEEIGKGLLTMAAGLLIMVGAMRLMPKDILLTSVGMIAVAESLVILSAALKNMGSMSWLEIAKGLVALAGSMLILAVALNAMDGALPGAAAMLVVSAALAIFVPELKALGSMGIGEVATGLLGLAGIFAIIGVAGLLLTPLVPTLIGLAGAMLLMGLGCAAVGGGLALFALGLSALAVSGAAGAGAIVLLVNTILGLIPTIAAGLVAGIMTFVTLIAANAPLLVDAFVKLVVAVLKAIQTLVPEILKTFGVMLISLLALVVALVPAFAQAFWDIITAILQIIAAHVPDVVQAGMDILVGFLKGIADNIEKVVTETGKIISKFLKGIAESLPEIIQSGADLLLSFLNGLTDAVNKNAKAISDAGINLAGAIINAVVSAIGDSASAIAGALWKLIQDALKSLLSLATGGTSNDTSTKDTSKQVGQIVVQNLADGVKSSSGVMAKAMTGVANDAVTSFSTAISGISNSIADNIDSSPKIRPVVDLTNVIESGKKINGLIGSANLVAAGVSYTLSSISNGMSNPAEPDTSINQPVQPATITYTQINNSPKTLSSLDIYRQTKAQLTTLKKGLVGAT